MRHTQWGESVFGSAATYSAAALSTRAQLGLAAVTGALLATDYEAYRNHAWSDVKGKARAPALLCSRLPCVTWNDAHISGATCMYTAMPFTELPAKHNQSTIMG